MPNAGLQTIKIGTPRSSGLKLLDDVNAMYQSGFIGSDEKATMTKLISSGMDTGDFTELYGIIAEQCLRASPENPFWDQMRGFLSEEVTK